MDELKIPEGLLNVQPIRQVIFDYLRSAILRKQLLPGQKMVEREIAERFQVSRTPVREALQRLAVEGFLERKNSKSYYIRIIAYEEVNEAYRLREVLEPLMVKMAMRNLSSTEKDSLEKALKKAEEANRKGDYDAVSDHLLEFDLTLMEAAKMPKLKNILLELQESLRRFKRTNLSQPVRRQEALLEHKKIKEAILSGDECSAAQRTLEHIQNSRQDLEQILYES